MQLPTEGHNPTLKVFGYVKDIQPLLGNEKEVYAFTALYNSSAKGTGKVWRRVLYVWSEKENEWRFMCEVRKGTTWRGPGYKLCYWPHYELMRGKWSENWFSDEAEAEKFMMLTWEFFV